MRTKKIRKNFLKLRRNKDTWSTRWIRLERKIYVLIRNLLISLNFKIAHETGEPADPGLTGIVIYTIMALPILIIGMSLI